jgi:hypothetical protein
MEKSFEESSFQKQADSLPSWENIEIRQSLFPARYFVIKIDK